jgi:hypothetical protein
MNHAAMWRENPAKKFCDTGEGEAGMKASATWKKICI